MSIRKRKWTTGSGEAKEAWVVDYVDQQGKRRLKTFAKKKEADAFETTMRGEVVAGTHVADSATLTVAVAGAKWIESCAALGLERTTLDQYRQHLELHIVPFMGRTKLSQLSVQVIRDLQDRLRDSGRSPAMVKRVTTSLGSLIADAQERGSVSRNAVREMARSRARGKARQGERRRRARAHIGVDIPTREEIGAIVAALSPRWRPLLLTAIFSGLRASELRGLRWSDIDLQESRLHVRQRADRYQEMGMPKSDAGQRSVPLPALVTNALREWKLACPMSDGDLAFPNSDGQIEWHSNIVTRGFIPAQIAGVVVDTGKSTRMERRSPAQSTRGSTRSGTFMRRGASTEAHGGLELSPKVVQERSGPLVDHNDDGRLRALVPEHGRRSGFGGGSATFW